MKSIFAVIVFLFAVSIGTAQTVGPVYVECNTKKCNLSFTVQNDQLKPSNFTIEAFDGTQFTSLRSLASSEHLELSQMSGRLSPKETRRIDFKFKCDTSPCNLTLLTGFMDGRHTADGVAVRLILPTTIYACSAGKNCRQAALEAAGIQTKKK